MEPKFVSSQKLIDQKGHHPVMLREVLDYLAPQKDRIYVDGTFGGGGYSEGILEKGAWVYGIDRDPEAEKRATFLKKRYPTHFTFILGNFGDMATLLGRHKVTQVHGIVLDLGVSSFQLDQGERGFSFRLPGPLDMRMSQSGQSAAEVVNTFSEQDLASLIRQYGEEKWARKIARKIVQECAWKPFSTTTELATCIRQVVSKSKDGLDPATRTFQALRIFINDEISELQKALSVSENLLLPGARLAVVAFHSLEDRCIKEFMRSRSQKNQRGRSRYLPELFDLSTPAFDLVERKAIRPSVSECRENPRARSARLRVCAKRGQISGRS